MAARRVRPPPSHPAGFSQLPSIGLFHPIRFEAPLLRVRGVRSAVLPFGFSCTKDTSRACAIAPGDRPASSRQTVAGEAPCGDGGRRRRPAHLFTVGQKPQLSREMFRSDVARPRSPALRQPPVGPCVWIKWAHARGPARSAALRGFQYTVTNFQDRYGEWQAAAAAGDGAGGAGGAGGRGPGMAPASAGVVSFPATAGCAVSGLRHDSCAVTFASRRVGGRPGAPPVVCRRGGRGAGGHPQGCRRVAVAGASARQAGGDSCKFFVWCGEFWPCSGCW